MPIVDDAAKKDPSGASPIVTRSDDPESRCARCLYAPAQAEAMGGPEECAGVPPPPCADYWEAVKSDPAGTLGRSVAVYILGEQVIAGALCSSVLATNPYGWAGCQVIGHFFGEAIAQALNGFFASFGLKDCRNGQPNSAHQTLVFWNAIRGAEDAGAHVMSDPIAPGNMWTIAAHHGNQWVNVGLAGCEDGDWFKGEMAAFQASVAAEAAASQARADKTIAKRAAEIAKDEAPTCGTGSEITEQCLRIVRAAFAIAYAEQVSDTRDKIERINSNIENFVPGTLSPKGNEDAAWQASVRRQVVATERAERAERATALMDDALTGEGPFAVDDPDGLKSAHSNAPEGGSGVLGLLFSWPVILGAGAAAYYYRRPILRALKRAST